MQVSTHVKRVAVSVTQDASQVCLLFGDQSMDRQFTNRRQTLPFLWLTHGQTDNTILLNQSKDTQTLSFFWPIQEHIDHLSFDQSTDGHCLSLNQSKDTKILPLFKPIQGHTSLNQSKDTQHRHCLSLNQSIKQTNIAFLLNNPRTDRHCLSIDQSVDRQKFHFYWPIQGQTDILPLFCVYHSCIGFECRVTGL